MANLTKCDFILLDVSGKNYLTWVIDAELHLASHNLGKTVKEQNDASPQDRAKAMIILRHHLDESLKAQYLTVKNPYELWKSLKDRFGHQRTVILPRARQEWIQLRLQDFKRVADYNSELYRISSTLKLCGETINDEDLLEKTFSTFHASNMVLQQQYRERGFKTYLDLISCLMLAEENNQLLLNNHQSRPTGSAPPPKEHPVFLEANATHSGRGRGKGRGRGNYLPRGRGKGRGRRNGRHEGKPNVQKNSKNEGKRGTPQEKKPKVDNTSHRCGSEGHWSCTCQTPAHLVKLYQDLMKDEKSMDTNYTEVNNIENTHLDVSDFLGTTGDQEMDLDDLLD